MQVNKQQIGINISKELFIKGIFLGGKSEDVGIMMQVSGEIIFLRKYRCNYLCSNFGSKERNRFGK
jgi:hypothetical protein